ncbi:MAG: aminoacetone oxidase family FAD-binding enzyme [Dehalococcoidales bacterium]|nr:aminoacetone oxidase family FAD-binding enzyme [Dehalococcoidales bacterium]
MKKSYNTAVIGGGAAGICAAITLARRGKSVIICEKTHVAGKKLLATGNGRCNLLNDELNESFYNPEAAELVRSVFRQFGKDRILSFFRGLGLITFSQEGRVFPITNQAASVLKVLEMELARLCVEIEPDFNCTSVSCGEKIIKVSSAEKKEIECLKVIVAAGGRSYPAFGSDGSMYAVAAQLGHRIITPVPCAVPLVVKDNLCFLLQGQRIFAVARSIIDGCEAKRAGGELLFTKYGLSGTCILDISQSVSAALNREHRSRIQVSIDLLPFLDREPLKAELEKRQKQGIVPEEMLAGLLPNKLCSAFKGLFEKNGSESVAAAAGALKDLRFKVEGTRGWNEAEFTCGGIDVSEIRSGTLESKIKKGVYFAGEILDVNGQRGGYNLAWAWASGMVAGKSG